MSESLSGINRKADILIMIETRKKAKETEVGGYIFISSGVAKEKKAASSVGTLLIKELESILLG